MSKTINRIALFIVASCCIVVGVSQVFPGGDAKIGLLLNGLGILMFNAFDRSENKE